MGNLINESQSVGGEGLAEIESKFGPSNFFRVMSHRPQAMRDFANLYETVMGTGTLELRLKELVYLAVSTVNECSYCTGHHEAAAAKAGLSAKEIENVRAETDYAFNERERTALRYARELTRTADTEHETIQALENMFQAEQRVELTMVIALANFTNRFNNGLSVPLERDKYRTA